MPTPSTRMGLLKPSTVDPFSTADLAANWQKIDDAPGTFICTSTTRPAWGAAQQGRLIYETDTDLLWRWTGSVFSRVAPKGLLTTTGGGIARGQRPSAFSTTSTTSVVVVSIDNVVVPAGNRTLMVTVTWSKITNTVGTTFGYIHRSNVNAQAPILGGWHQNGDSTSPTPGAQGNGGTFITYEPGGLAAGTYNWSFQVKCPSGGTTTISADATTPVEIAVIEL